MSPHAVSDREPRKRFAIAFGVSIAVHVVAFAVAGAALVTVARLRISGEHRTDDAIQLSIITVLPDEPSEAATLREQKIADAARPEEKVPETKAPEELATVEKVEEPIVATTPVVEPASMPTVAPAPLRDPESAPPAKNPAREFSHQDASATAPSSNHELECTYRPEPPYSLAARRQRLEGTVVIELNVNELGDVSDLKIKRSSGHAVLDNSAAATLRLCKFIPKRVGGVPVASSCEQTVQFKLQ